MKFPNQLIQFWVSKHGWYATILYILWQIPLFAVIYQHLKGQFIISRIVFLNPLLFPLFFSPLDSSQTTTLECNLDHVTSFPTYLQAFYCIQNKIPTLNQDYRILNKYVPAHFSDLLCTSVLLFPPVTFASRPFVLFLMFDSLAPLHTSWLTSPER